ncbi:hypothetical protein [Deinococcus sp. RM]|uniref:hypothetical protein n=1 Tax=Deinococcus sp. RM TaxID=2316359 RepID=UPI0018F72E3B|nr:hypothetical protein [Deinococcus sp. RM]
MARKPRTRLVDRSEYYEITGRLQHYACFHCRKAFKQGFPRSGEATLCPQCRQPMTNMGTDFKAPAQREHRQWQKVQQLAQAGVRFFPVGSTGTPGDRPATLAEVPAFLRRIHPPSAGQRDLEREPSTTSPAPREGKLEQQGHFPHQAYRLLGRPLESGSAIELFDCGHWQSITFFSRGNGSVPIPQPFARPRVGHTTYWFQQTPLFLTDRHRLRWPQQD